MFDTVSGVRRGFHAHKCLKQMLICVHGSCKILLDDGSEKQEVLLDKPNKGLIIESNIWREMFDFSEDAVLMVVASELYDESDYIRNYDDFIAYIREEKNEH
jgi:dTDP-4-dehydrorhamnose 3,5-epimerase-like enzyme